MLNSRCLSARAWFLLGLPAVLAGERPITLVGARLRKTRVSRDRNTATLGLLTRIYPPLPDNRAPKDVSLFKSSLRCIKFLLLSRKLSFGGVAEAAQAEGQLCALAPTPARPGRPGPGARLPVPPSERGGSGRTRLAAEGRAHFRRLAQQVLCPSHQFLHSRMPPRRLS